MQVHKHTKQRKGKEGQTTTQVKEEVAKEFGGRCTHIGKMEELQEQKKRERKHDKDHSVTHVKAKQNKNEMGITIPENNVHNLKKKSKQNTKRQTLFA